MINLDVSKNGQYRELNIETGDATITTGLLDDMEAVDIAIRLIFAAEELLPAEYSDEDEALSEIRRRLDK